MNHNSRLYFEDKIDRNFVYINEIARDRKLLTG